MSEELQIPPVIDIDALLVPISDDEPSGENLRYSGIYDEIAEARRADDALSQGDWQTELKTADHRKVAEIAIPALTTRSKDIQLAVWLTEALIKLHGLAGLRDGLKLLAALQDKFWDTLHPEIDEGDMEGRANAISWLDSQGTFVVRSAPLTSGAGYGYADWVDAKRFDIPDNLDSLDSESYQHYADLKAQAERENRVTSAKWKAALAQTRRAFCEKTSFTIEECEAALAELDHVDEVKYDRNQTPGLSNLKKTLDEVSGLAKKILERKRIEEPDPADSVAADENADGEVSAEGTSSGGGAGPVRGRGEALQRLAEIAAFFQRTEPHSPVAYLVQRAVKWGNMPLETWLRDVIKDENVLFQLRDTLGLDNSQGQMSDDSWGSAETSSEASATDEPSSDW